MKGKTYYSGESTDVVAHEVGHGLLDLVRPDFWSVNYLEVGAFHEAFGDCTALLTALDDGQTRKDLLAASTSLAKRNFVETTAEQLSYAIGQLIPGHNASEPRHAFNKLQYVLPQTLPSNGGPGELINEVHSFGMLFTGCFWDALTSMFTAAGGRTEAALIDSARTLYGLLVAAAKSAVVTPRFLQSVGRAMVLADETLHAGANRTHIRNAFQAHGILLGSNTMVAPTMALAGAAPKRASLSPATARDLLHRLGGTRAGRIDVIPHDLFGEPVAQALHAREVPLEGLDRSLKGVVALGHEPVLVGSSGGRAAVMGMMPNPVDTESEVRSFVEMLLAHDRIEFAQPPRAAMRRAAAAPRGKFGPATHAIETVGARKLLTRIRFVCPGGGGA